MADARDYLGKRGESLVASCLLDFCGRRLPYFDPHPLDEKCPIFDYLIELVTDEKSPPYLLASVKSTTKGTTRQTRKRKVALKAKDVQAMGHCPVPTYSIGVDEPGERVISHRFTGN